jgi:hypothetical protein
MAERLGKNGYSGMRTRVLPDASVELFAEAAEGGAIAVRIVAADTAVFTLVARTSRTPHDGPAMRRFLSSFERVR